MELVEPQLEVMNLLRRQILPIYPNKKEVQDTVLF